MTPKEIKFHSWKTENATLEDMAVAIDIIETVKLQAAANLTKYQDETRRWKNKKVKPREIKEGDLVLRRIPKEKTKGKMNSKWEGPFLVTEMARPEAHRFRTLDGIDNKSTLYRKNVRAAGGLITQGDRRNIFCIFFFRFSFITIFCKKRCIQGPVLFSSRGKPLCRPSRSPKV
jgi:hypothetical protein